MLASTYTGWRMPFGYEPKEKKPAVNSKQAKVVKQIYELALSGKTQREILYHLNEKHIPTQTGKEWSSGVLVNFFKRDRIMFYAGYIGDKKDLHESIIDPATARKLVEKFSSGQKSRPHLNEFLLSNLGILHCGYCGGKAKTVQLPINKKEVKDYYLCTTRQMYGAGSGKCKQSKTIPQIDVNEKVITDIALRSNLESPEEFHSAYEKKIKKEVDEKSATTQKEISALLEKQFSVTTKKQLDEINFKLTSLTQKRQSIIAPYAALASASDLKQAKNIKKLSLHSQRELIKKIIFRIDLFSNKVVLRYNFGIAPNGNNISEIKLDGKLVRSK